MVDDVEVGEGCKICAFAILTNGADETDRPRSNTRDKELVIVHCRAAFLVWVNLSVFLRQVGRVVRSISGLPVWLGGLDIVKLIGLVEWGSRSFDLCKVRVWVSLDGGFSVRLRFGRVSHGGV